MSHSCPQTPDGRTDGRLRDFIFCPMHMHSIGQTMVNMLPFRDVIFHGKVLRLNDAKLSKYLSDHVLQLVLFLGADLGNVVDYNH